MMEDDWVMYDRNLAFRQGQILPSRNLNHTLNTCGDLCVATKTNYVEILNFRHFFKHIVFTSEGDKIRNKEIKNYINVSVVVDIECGNTNN